MLAEPKKAGAFGRSEESRVCWIDMVTSRFEVTRDLFVEYKYARMTRAIDYPGAWMMDKWKRWGRPEWR